MKKPTLGVVMIVKNEEKNLGGILSDIKGVVDEICVVDTGSSDGTVAVAESFGVRIGHFPWVNDFAAARNHSIELARADYLLWLDADDRIDARDRQALLTLKAMLRPQKDRVYMLKILSSAEDASASLSYQTRIIPNRDRVRFAGRVHEQILPTVLKQCAIQVETVDITIRHTGYHDPQARPAKARRNLDILLQELREGKDTATQNFFIAMAYVALEDYESCLAYFAQARAKRTEENWYHISFVVVTECLLRLNRREEALQEILRGAALFPDSPLMHYYLGNVFMQAGRYTEAAEALGKAATLPPRIDAYPTPPDLGTIILVQYGKVLEKSGRLDDAIAVYTRAMQTGARQTDLFFALGMALLQQGRVEEALPQLEEAHRLTPQFDPILWLALAKVHLFLGHHAKAHALYREGFSQIPDDRDAATGLIQSSVALDDVESLVAALETLMHGLGMNTDRDIATPADIAGLCAEVGGRLYETDKSPLATRLGEAALSIDPGCAAAHLLLFDIFSADGRRAEAIPHLEQATRAGAPLAMLEERLAGLESR